MHNINQLRTEVCFAQTALSALKDGHEVSFVADASGALSPEAQELASQQMIQAGARPPSWFAAVAEWCPDNSSPECQCRYPIMLEHGIGVQWGVEYVMANLPRSA